MRKLLGILMASWMVVSLTAQEQETIIIKKEVSGNADQVEVEVVEENGEQVIYINGEKVDIEELQAAGPDRMVQVKVVKKEEPYPRMGVIIEDVKDHGAVVKEVLSGSNAAKKGLRPGDMIFALDKKEVTSSTDVVDILKKKKEGDCVQVDYLRNGKTKRKKVKLQAAQAEVVEVVNKEMILLSEEDTWEHPETLAIPEINIYELSVDVRKPQNELLLEFVAERTPTIVTVIGPGGDTMHKEDLPDFDGRYIKLIPIDASNLKGTKLIISQKGSQIEHILD